MAEFTVRVELHAATWADYETLHRCMEAEGFARTITSDEGVVYQLPTAEYNFVGNLTRAQVLSKAQRAAAQTRLSYSILNTESKGRIWCNLSVVRRAALRR